MSTTVVAVETKGDVLLAHLRRFYDDPTALRELSEALHGPRHVSLRVLDWLVTNYSNKNKTVYVTARGEPFNVYTSYKSMLRAHSKRHFDPFCRQGKIRFADADGRPFNTTIGQLNFFRWAIQYGVLAYAREQYQEIERDMLASTQHRGGASDAGIVAKDPAPRKRRELSKSAYKAITTTSVRVIIGIQ